MSDGNFASSASVIAGQFKCKKSVKLDKTIIMIPELCFQHKIDFMREHGGDYVDIRQVGKDFGET